MVATFVVAILVVIISQSELLEESISLSVTFFMGTALGPSVVCETSATFSMGRAVGPVSSVSLADDVVKGLKLPLVLV